MKKCICFVLIILLPVFSLLGKDVTPDIKNTTGNIFYLGMSIDQVEDILGKPKKIYKEKFIDEKPEFDEVFWEYETGIVFSFYYGDRNVRKIKLSTNQYSIEYRGFCIIPRITTLQDIENIFGKGYEIENTSPHRILEYYFDKKQKHPFISDIIQFYFNNDICTMILIFEDTEFI